MNAMERIAADELGRLVFHGTRSAELFSRELAESLEGVLRFSYSSALEGENAGTATSRSAKTPRSRAPPAA